MGAHNGSCTLIINRRDAIRSAAIASLGLAVSFKASAETAPPPGQFASWRWGVDNQRMADLGNGMFRNPVLSGDRPDPAILKDGEDYYLTFSSFESYPGLLIWHSRDLGNWQPRKPALHRNIGSVWAVSLEKRNGRYFLYIPVKASPRNDIFVIWADHIDGPWSDPVSLGLHTHIARVMPWANAPWARDKVRDDNSQLRGAVCARSSMK